MTSLSTLKIRIAVPSWLPQVEQDMILNQLERHYEVIKHYSTRRDGKQAEFEIVPVACYSSKTLEDINVAVAFKTEEEFNWFLYAQGVQNVKFSRNYLEAFTRKHTRAAVRDRMESKFYATVVRHALTGSLGLKPDYKFTGKEVIPDIYPTGRNK
jgi:hypothetical protein